MSAPQAPLRFARDPQEDELSPPPINVRYFYSSPIAIDDPLSPLPPPGATSYTVFKGVPRPSSAFDNAILDKTWLDVRQRTIKQAEDTKAEKRRSQSGTAGSSAALLGGGATSLNAFRKPSAVDRKRNYGPDSPSSSPALKPRSIPLPDGSSGRKHSASV